MSSALDHGQVVLSAIVPKRQDNLMYALSHIQPEHFHNKVQRIIYATLENYFTQTGGILPEHILADLLDRKGLDAAQTLLFLEVYRQAESTSVADHEFRYAISALKDLKEQEKTGEVIASAFEILERGTIIDKVERRGHRAAREYLYDQLAKIDRLAGSEAAPEGDMRTEVEQMLADYAARKSGEMEAGIPLGLPTIDYAMSGVARGDLVLFAAYTSQGKSALTVQSAWNAAVNHGKNVYYATSETVRAQINRRIVARHSRLPQFECPDGINSHDIKNGTLTDTEEEVYRAVLDDLKNNPSYGKLHIAQIPRGATLSYLEARMSRQQQSWDIDLCCIDYLNLLKPDFHRQSAREEANDTLKDAKVLATSFNEGRGVGMVSPWQMSQARYRDALDTGHYTLGSLADTSEAEKSADVILSLLRLPQEPLKTRAQLLKCRDGALPPLVEFQTDFRTSYLSEETGTGYGDEGEDEFADLLEA